MISALVLTKNEEKNIIDCLDCLDFCDEVIVVDDESTDRTRELVEDYSKGHKGIKLETRKLDGDFSKQRKFGIEKASNDWILIVDADERVSKELSEEILENISEDYGGFLVPRKDFMWDKQLAHGETGKIELLRLFDKRKGELKGRVHEVWVTKSKVGNLFNPILHYPHPTISTFLKDINFYTEIRAKELFDQGVKTNGFYILLYAKAKFLVNYVFKLGFLDGMAGLVHAIMMSFHSFLVRGKLWLLWQKADTK